MDVPGSLLPLADTCGIVAPFLFAPDTDRVVEALNAKGRAFRPAPSWVSPNLHYSTIFETTPRADGAAASRMAKRSFSFHGDGGDQVRR